MEGFPVRHAQEIEPTEEVPIPEGWAFLTHGSNLGRVEWSGEGSKQLDADVLILERKLSVIGEVERQDARHHREALRERGIFSGDFDTTKTYSLGSGQPLTIRIVFPAYGERYPKFFNELKESWVQKYGKERAEQIAKLVNDVHHLNNSRHPQLSAGLRLIKIRDESTVGRVVTYVPEVLKDIYDSEISHAI